MSEPIKRPRGRPKGSKSKVSKEARHFFGRLWKDKEFRRKFAEDWRAGKVPPPLMVAAAHYAFGKPVDQIEVGGEGSGVFTGPVTVVVNGKTYVSGGDGHADDT